MLKVAITGNIASGKSSLAGIWVRAGVPLVSADGLAREAVEPGTPGLEAVLRAFGPGIIGDDGTLDRDSLRGIVFRDPALRHQLEAILHPLINNLRKEWLQRQADKGSKLAVAEIPLLFEAGLEENFDLVVFVDAPSQERLRRLVEIRGLNPEEALRILDAQMSPDQKLTRADYVIHNSGTEVELEVRALALLDLLRARASRKEGR